MNFFSPVFKLTITPLLFAILACVGLSNANAQSLSNSQQESNSAAVNSGVSTVFNSYGTPLSVIQQSGRQDLHSNQAFGVAPSFSSPAVIGTCATAGKGAALQLVGGGASFAGGGETEAGCDLERDLRIMKSVGATQDDALERVCMKPELAKSMKACRDKEEAKQAAIQDPYIKARLQK